MHLLRRLANSGVASMHNRSRHWTKKTTRIILSRESALQTFRTNGRHRQGNTTKDRSRTGMNLVNRASVHPPRKTQPTLRNILAGQSVSSLRHNRPSKSASARRRRRKTPDPRTQPRRAGGASCGTPNPRTQPRRAAAPAAETHPTLERKLEERWRQLQKDTPTLESASHGWRRQLQGRRHQRARGDG